MTREELIEARLNKLLEGVHSDNTFDFTGEYPREQVEYYRQKATADVEWFLSNGMVLNR